jgi:cytochrome P450
VTGLTSYKLVKFHEKYGNVVRIAPNELSYASAGVWKDVWAHRQGHKEFRKARFRAPPNGIYGILAADKENHSRYRRLLSNSFSEKAIRSQQSTIQSHVDLLMENLRGKVAKGPQNMVQWFNWTTFDIIGRLALGESFVCLEKQEMHPWINAIFGNVKAVMFTVAIRKFGLESILPLLMSSQKKRDFAFNWEYSSNKIEERVKRGTNEGDFWDNVLQKSLDDKGQGMSIEEMKSNASHLVLAGSETTATLLSGVLYHLLRNPEVMDKLVNEIRTTFRSSEAIDLFSVGDLKYSEAVLSETMRIYPPVPSMFPRIVPEGGDTVEGRYVPAGTELHMRNYVVGHLSSYFTKHDEFHPERFLGAEEFQNDNFAVLQPFSVGPRNCIGRNLANAEMRLILAKLLWHFDFELDRRSVNWTDQKSFVLWEKPPLWVNIKSARS